MLLIMVDLGLIIFIEQEDKTMMTPHVALIITAISHGNKDFVALLIRDKRVDINSPDQDGNTFLHYAIGLRKYAIADWLLEHGANVNAQNTEEMTPLHLAVLLVDGESINLLVEHNANVMIPDDCGLTAFSWAIKLGVSSELEQPRGLCQDEE